VSIETRLGNQYTNFLIGHGRQEYFKSRLKR
jgi:hypothetical protein